MDRDHGVGLGGNNLNHKTEGIPLEKRDFLSFSTKPSRWGQSVLEEIGR
jgi:hypothetical protein